MAIQKPQNTIKSKADNLYQVQPGVTKLHITDMAIFIGTATVAITELLSLGDLITRPAIAISWLIVLSIAITIYKKPLIASLRLSPNGDRDPTKTALFIFLYSACALTLLISLIYPPNNFDSMTYHMARVAHWTQDMSVKFFRTGNVRQVLSGPGAEYAILHTYILTGTDRFANLIQWASMLGSLIVTYLIAVKLSKKETAGLYAAVITATIPAGIMQSTSTQNDYAAGFWILVSIYKLLQYREERQIRTAILLGLAAGLAALTKASSAIFLAPFALLAIDRRTLSKETVLHILTAVFAIILLNISQFLRNYALTENILGISKDLADVTMHVRTPDFIASNMVRNIAVNLGIPHLNGIAYIESMVVYIHSLLGISASDPNSSFYGQPFMIGFGIHEDWAGNLLHTLIIFLAIPLIFIRKRIDLAQVYCISLVLSFLIFSALLRWQPWINRIMLPLFLLSAPLIGAVLSDRLKETQARIVLMIFCFYSLPYYLLNETRGALGDQGYRHSNPSYAVYPPSFLRKSRLELYFSNRADLYDQFLSTAAFIKDSTCRVIGIYSHENSWEYPLWKMVSGKRDARVIEHVEVQNVSNKLPPDTTEPPCIVVAIDKSPEEIRDIKEKADICWINDLNKNPPPENKANIKKGAGWNCSKSQVN